MRRLITVFIAILLIVSCQSEKKSTTDTTQKTKALVSGKMMESAIIYEANIRQYSPEGSFAAFAKDIPMLHDELGVKIIWLMPVFPISETKRKATGDTFVSDIKDENERKKYMGSYYAVSDYRGVSNDYGSKDDLRYLIKVAHENDVLVILDWVPNHTGWDHQWIKEHPDFYTKNATGEITDPLNNDGSSKGWQDVADLNYDNKGLRKAMISDMKYWLTDENIDGFRCDVAGEVPISFWKEAIPQLRKVKPIFMLAEAWEPELLKANLFDMCYGWENHFLMADIAKGRKTVKDWDSYIKKMDTFYEKDDIIMNFTTNHDENSWKGTVTQTFGEADELMAVLSYLAPGMPLIYSGQEYDLDHKLKFFEKDSFPKVKGRYFKLYTKLKKLKIKNTSLNGGKNKAHYRRIKPTNDTDILAFYREKDQDKILFIANLTGKTKEFSIDFKGAFTSFDTGKNIQVEKGEVISLPKWGYLILKN
jgi:glycosidase